MPKTQLWENPAEEDSFVVKGSFAGDIDRDWLEDSFAEDIDKGSLEDSGVA